MTFEPTRSSRIWQAVNAIVLVISCLSLGVLFPETVYRDNYRNHKKDTNLTTSSNGEDAKQNPISAIEVINDINNRIRLQATNSTASFKNVCTSLFREQRGQRNCQDHINKELNHDTKIAFVDENAYPWLSKLKQTQKAYATEDALYLEYLATKEIGVKFALANQLTAPHLFIMIFVFLGLAASSIGNLIIDAINHKAGRENVNPPLSTLLLGPVVSCLVAAILIYIFTPSGEERQYFSKKILDIPIAVYISSFLLSFSPINTVENIAHFVFSQIKTISGATLGKHETK